MRGEARRRRGYTKADIADAGIGDKTSAADHVCLLGYRVGPSDVDLLRDLDRVIHLDAEVANGALDPMASGP